MAPVLIRPPSGPVISPSLGRAPLAPVFPQSAAPVGGATVPATANPLSPPIGAGGAGAGGYGSPSSPMPVPLNGSGPVNNQGPGTVPGYKPLFTPLPQDSPQDIMDELARRYPHLVLPPNPFNLPTTNNPRNPNENLAPGQSPKPNPRRSPLERNTPRPSAPTIGPINGYLRVRFSTRTWDGVTGSGSRGGVGPFAGIVYEQSPLGQRVVYMQFNGYRELIGLDQLPGPNGEDYNTAYSVTGVEKFDDPAVQYPPNPTKSPPVIPSPDGFVPGPTNPPPYNDPKPFRRPAKPPQPAPPQAPPTTPPAPAPTPNPTKPPGAPDRERKVPPPTSPPSPAPSRPGPTTTPNPGTNPSTTPTPREFPSTPTPFPGTTNPSGVPGMPPTPAPLGVPREVPTIPNIPPLLRPTVPATASPPVEPGTLPNTTPPAPPLGPNGPGVTPGWPYGFDRYGEPERQRQPTTPLPPLVALPPQLDCCDLDSVLDYQKQLKDYIRERFDELEDCACPVTAVTTTTEIASGINNANISLPANVVAIRFRVANPDGNMRSEWGGGSALDVDYVGWYSVSMFQSFGGKRTQIQYSNQVVEVSPGSRFLSVTAKGATLINVDAVVMSGFRDKDGFSIPTAVRGSERLYRS